MRGVVCGVEGGGEGVREGCMWGGRSRGGLYVGWKE